MFQILLLTVLSTSTADPAKLTYMEGYNKAIKENKQLFVWRGVKDDYLISKFSKAIHVFNPDLSKIKHDFPNVGVIVASPYTKTQLKIDIQTSQIGELADKLASKRESVEPLTKKRVVRNGLFYDLYSNGTLVPCSSCNSGR